MKAAIYSRYSTDRQSESSIEDQNRVCTDYALQNDLQVVTRFEDQGISGAAMGNRPGFLAMMDAALASRFDVVLVMDLSRLSRSQSDLPKTIDRLVHKGIQVIGVQDGYDSTRKGHKMQAGLSGIIGEAFREMVAERTYTALETRARRGDKTGGKCYGYRDGAIYEPEAKIIRQIFQWYVDGYSPRWIAAELNRRGVPSPGSTWNRTVRRAKGWCPSAIHGDPRRGSGMVNNELYVGRRIWSRLKWSKHPDSGKRRSIVRPSSQWIVQEEPDLRIIDDSIWRQVKARQRRANAEIGDKIRQGLKRYRGQAPRHIFTGLLKCSECGSNLVMADTRAYCCSGYINGRICSNGIRVKRQIVESRLLSSIQEDLLTDESISQFKKRIVRACKRPDPRADRRQELQAEIDRYADAIAAGLMSTTIKTRIEAAEAALADLASDREVIDVGEIIAALPRLLDRYKAQVKHLAIVARSDPDRARECIRSILGQIIVRPDDGILVAEVGLNETPLTALAGGVPMEVVAGAGFEPATFGL